MLGIDPGNLTLRELLEMATARRHEDWSHTAEVLAMIVNVNRDPKRRAVKGSDLNPIKGPREEVVGTTPITTLRDVFVRKPRKAPSAGTRS